MTKHPFFSIIIPVYNGLSHDLSRCLESIWSQSIPSDLYEVICVDDCSTDDTHAWLQQQQTKYNNLRVEKTPYNIRQGGARNLGMHLASGEYIMFIDQDDYFHPEAVEKVYKTLSVDKLDILIGDAVWVIRDKPSDTLQHNFKHTHVMSGDEVIALNGLPFAPWKFIFRRSLIEAEQIYFEENQRIEDADWCFRLVHAAKRVQCLPLLLIYYIKNDISTTMTAYKSPETIFSTLQMAKRLKLLCETIFSHSTKEVQQMVSAASRVQLTTGIRNYFFCIYSLREKSCQLKNVMSVCDAQGSLLLRIAQTHPALFALLSNVACPFALATLYIYRLLKYRLHILR